MSISPDDVTASVLQQHCAGHGVAGRIETASGQLRALVTDLDRIVHANRALLEHEISAVDYMVQGITVDRTATPRYLRSGAQADAPRIRLLDAQV